MKWKKQVLKEGSRNAPTKPKGRPKKNSIPSYSDIIKAAGANETSMCESSKLNSEADFSDSDISVDDDDDTNNSTCENNIVNEVD